MNVTPFYVVFIALYVNWKTLPIFGSSVLNLTQSVAVPGIAMSVSVLYVGWHAGGLYNCHKWATDVQKRLFHVIRIMYIYPRMLYHWRSSQFTLFNFLLSTIL